MICSMVPKLELHHPPVYLKTVINTTQCPGVRYSGTPRHHRKVKIKEMEKGRVCVTGAAGFQASWLVNLLLSKGYMVHGTVRDLCDEKNSHLKKLGNTTKRLHLFKADVLDYNSILAAIKGCTGVFHLACPVPSGSVPNPEIDMIEPAVTGTSNVLRACSEANIKRVVVLSSIGAILLNQHWPKSQPMDESCWSDKEYCKTTENWYCFSKTEAERQAIEYARTSGLDVITVCPPIIFGPVLQSKMNTSSQILLMLLKDGLETFENKVRMFVDARDVAAAILLVYEKPEAKGRYISSSSTLTLLDLVEKLKSMYPTYNYPKQIVLGGEEDWDISSKKLLNLGWKYRSLEETLVDSIKDYQDKGLLDKVDGVSKSTKE